MPRKLTPHLHKRIVDRLSTCAPINRAVEAEGISRETFYDWRRRGDLAIAKVERDAGEDVEGDELMALIPESERPFALFARDVRETLGRLANLFGQRLMLAGQRDWKATAWLAERKFPEEFGASIPERAKQAAMAYVIERLKGRCSAETFREVLLALNDEPGADDSDLAGPEDEQPARH